MFGVWLVAALAMAGANQMQPAPAPGWMVGADVDDVRQMLGRPDDHDGCGGISVMCWWRIDWLGSRHMRTIIFIKGIASSDETTYEPFVASSPWLAALRKAAAPNWK
ncbi:MAG TPA: hypothetical protein VMS17_29490 [Gemmataceae bacterium]|nr:hypothetical protein [Gemmataceae bacterium]